MKRMTAHLSDNVLHVYIIHNGYIPLGYLYYSLLRSLGVPSPVCILELSRQHHIDMAVKITTIFM